MHKTRDAGLLRRCQIVLNYARSRGCTLTSEALGCAPSTAIRVARRYQEEGEEGLEDRRAENGRTSTTTSPETTGASRSTS